MVQRAVINHFDMTLPELKGHRRTAKFVRPRHIAMYLCRELLDRSLLQVGKLFGRDHTTVMFAVGKIEPVAWTDPDVLAIRNQILGDLPQTQADPNQLALTL